MYVGRQKELEELNAFYEGNQCQVAVVKGTLGMGKTTLLKHFAADKSSLYFCAYETTAQQETDLLARALKIKTGISLQKVLDTVTKRARKEKQLLILDQYPSFVKAGTDFNEILLSYVTGAWAELPIKLILCGDAFLLMDKYVCGKKAIWKGHTDLEICLEAMKFQEAKEFFSYAQPDDRAILYGISGGIPGQMIRLQEQKAAPRQAVEILFDPAPGRASLLPEQVMGTELRELSYYNCILSAMAQGMNRVNQLSEAVDKPKDVIVPYLNALMSIGVVTKQNAITEESNRKKTRYFITNHNFVFWYRYLVPYRDLYMTGAWDELWEEHIAPDLESFMQQVFIDISREHMEEQSQMGQMPFAIERSGNWWTNDDEAGTTEGFDVVSLGKAQGKSATVFTQCFYNEEPVEIIKLKELIDRTKQLHREGEVFYVACSKKGFHENAITVASTIKNIILIPLEEMCS
jgi:AAA+ ATPase superfamily predicted ATPase